MTESTRRIRIDDFGDEESGATRPTHLAAVPFTGSEGSRVMDATESPPGDLGYPEQQVQGGSVDTDVNASKEYYEESILEMPIAPDITDPQPPSFSKPEPATWHNWLTGAHNRWTQEKQEHDAWYELDAKMRRAMEDVNEAMWAHVRGNTLVVAVTHNKGGVGKTPTATNLAARAAQGTNLPVILYDGNPDLGGAALRSGMNPEDTLTLSQYYELHETVTFQELSGCMPPTRHGVLVVAADPDEIARNITAVQSRNMLESLKRHARIIIIDLGTGVSSPVNEVAHRMADVFVYPMLTLSGVNTTAGAVDGRNSTQKRLIAQSESDSDDTYNLVALKAQFGLTLAIGLDAPTEIPQFQTAIGSDNRMLVIPFDQASNETRPVWLPHQEGNLLPQEGRVSARTALAWGKAVNALFEQAAVIREMTQERVKKMRNNQPSNQHGTTDDTTHPPDSLGE